MKAAVLRILILRPAGIAHGEGGHRSRRAVIRYVADDGIARSAMGAVGEGISVAPIRRIPKVPPASVASARIGRDQRKFTRLLPAAKDGEAGVSLNRDFGDFDLRNLCKLRTTSG